MIDTHTHVVSADEERFPLQCVATDPDDPSAWPLHARVTAEELLAEMQDCDVAGACLVQGYAAYRFDNRYAVMAAEAHPERFVSVCALDTRDPRSPERLEVLAGSSRLRGVRLVTGLAGEDEGLDGEGALRIWEAADRLGLVVVAFAFADQLDGLSTALASFGERPVVLDHCGFLDLTREFERLGPLARFENLHLKVSSRVLVQGEPAALVRRLADRFGAERLMWGSDFPASHERSYGGWVDLARAAAGALSSAESEHFLGRTALRVWPELAGD